MPPSTRSNIPKYFLYMAIHGLALGTPVVLWVVYLQRRNGYTLTMVTLLDLPFWFGKFLFEIPTGVVADRYGRKLSLGISSVISSLTWLVFASTGSFLWMSLAQFAGGAGATFSSGADEALLYESLQAAGREGEYARVSAQARAVETASAMLAGLAVGVIAERNLALPVLLTAVIELALLLPLLSLAETRRACPDDERQPYMQIVRRAAGVLREHGSLRLAVAGLVVLGSVAFYASTFLQPYTLAVGLPIAILGPVMVAAQLMSVGGGLALPWVQRALGDRAILLGAPLLLVPCLLLMGAARGLPGLAIGTAAAFFFALVQPVLLAAVQARAPADARATLLSIQSLLFTVFLTASEPALGLLADRFGVQAAYLGMAALVAACLPLIYAYLAGRQPSR